MAGKLATLMMVIIGAGLLVGMLMRPLLLPWLLASAIFIMNYSLTLLFLRAMGGLKAGAAIGVALLSFLVRFGLIGLGLLLVALALPSHLLATALCFLVVYTAFLSLEIIVALRSRTASAGGEA
jgi:hypothetical protein